MEVQLKFRKTPWGTEICNSCVVSDQVIVQSKWKQSAKFFLPDIMSPIEIKSIYFEKCLMKKLPPGLSEKFPNCEILSVNKCGLEEITINEISGFQHLKTLWLPNNELTSLPSDLFTENPTITNISFKGNKLINIGRGILDPLANILCVDFKANIRIDYKFRKINKMVDERRFKILIKKLNKIEQVRIHTTGGIHADIDDLLSDNDCKDLTIEIQDKAFQVHKFLLIARSSVIREMFKKDPNACRVSFADITPETFEIILDFVYEDKFPEKEEVDYMEVYATAAKMNIRELKEFSTGKLMAAINDNNALKIMSLAKKYESGDLKLKAFQHIKSLFPDKKLKLDLAETPEIVEKLLQARNEIQKYSEI